MIQLKGIRKVYNFGKSNEFEALSNINISINEGEMIAIIGKSGAGKSTLLHILAGIDSFEEGTFQVAGTDIGHMKEKELADFRNKRVGMVMQDFALVDSYTVEENVLIPLIFGKVNRKKRKEMIHKVLCQLGIEELSRKAAGKLSGGQKQRVAIARAIVNNPDFILADEPTGALDSQTAESIMQVFEHLNETGHTVIIVTHDMEIAKRCKRIIRIVDGKIVE